MKLKFWLIFLYSRMLDAGAESYQYHWAGNGTKSKGYIYMLL